MDLLKVDQVFSDDERYMWRCLELAIQAAGRVAPNPMVGAVLVYQGCIIGEGYHQQSGGPHAEVNCLQSVPASQRHLISQSTLYVNLEPCAHYGKTPPCADLIVAHRIPRVVIGQVDPFPAVQGRGIARLQQAGVQVQVGVLEKQCGWLNRRFFTFHQHHRPYVILKWAQSRDGYLAPPNRQRMEISHPYTRYWVHRWRAEEAAILVGARTALHDNPRLNNRYWYAIAQPSASDTGRSVRMVIDPHLQVPGTHHIFDQSMPTWIFNFLESRQEGNTHWIRLQPNASVVEQVLAYAYANQLQSLIVEGGAATLKHFLDAGLWDEARVIYSSTLLGDGLPAPVLQHAQLLDEMPCGTDRICWYQHVRSQK
ncbi:bifunctional diaminohydroxyphosphoribosylaminopyrimidine deaminase/5-amino-6-(5-phosphoribosylamino)uracil reductase RibD [Thermoflavifilum thermophilum]|uniref:Riboflavin biosynthesis protein RibD n=1 Tax=Thermoflavifilum thermophilum TaxID=1393122 RepID=A0A1I7NI66_9BACT|nr:bifunctional diaminohydroxyphosphoribosylaminopyrimidine deaminase/5-amino-6-(5-phosphoribosylamino)uracil reductase RibD [Thermoflavifilum thermophilum]SFV34246.1 diaminohydroxyphosphoribosylaminopyrimidine deaminase [Thermoflavifilum thermophilum]